MPRYDIFKAKTGGAIRQLATLNPLTIHKKGSHAKAVFCLAMVCLLWGTTWIASKEGVRHMPAMQLVGIRQVLGGLAYVIFFITKGITWPSRKQWGIIFILALLNFALSNGLSTWALQYVSAGLGAINAAMFPLWIVVIGLFTSKEKMPRLAIAGLLLGFAGVCIIFGEHINDFLNPGFRFGILLSLTASWTWAFGTIFTKKNAASANMNPYFSLGLQMLISGIMVLGITHLTDRYTGNATIAYSAIPWQSWLSILYLVLVGSVISFIAYLYMLQRLPTGQASLYAYINPVVAVLLGSLLFQESLTMYIAIGGAVTLLGVFLVNKGFKQKQKREE